MSREETDSDRILALALTGGGISEAMALFFVEADKSVQSNQPQTTIPSKKENESK